MSDFFTENEIKLIYNNWAQSKHSINNPEGSWLKVDYDTEEKKELRRQDLIALLRIIHEDFIKDQSLFISKNQLPNAFFKYVRTRIIDSFPYQCFNPLQNKDCDILDFQNGYCQSLLIDKVEESEFKEWLNKYIFQNQNKISNKADQALDFMSDEKEIQSRLKLRYKRLKNLARIAHFIDSIQYRDYKQAGVVFEAGDKIQLKRNGSENLIYGHKHSLSAYLGQHIVRCYIFKDLEFFESKKVQKNKEFDKKHKIKPFYEHWTPMSFFRDLIWVKPLSNNGEVKYGIEGNIYSENQWLSLFWHCYRTINIHISENVMLDGAGFRARRPYNVYSLLDNFKSKKSEIKLENIEIAENQEGYWKISHCIEKLKEIDSAFLNGES